MPGNKEKTRMRRDQPQQRQHAWFQVLIPNYVVTSCEAATQLGSPLKTHAA